MSFTPTLTGQDIAQAQGAVRALLDRVLESTGVTSDEYVTMRILGQRRFSPAELHDFLVSQRQLRLDRPGVDALLSGLIQRGLITGDHEVVLTEAGRTQFAALTEAVGSLTKRLYEPFAATDLAIAHRVLTELAQRANELSSQS
jgi:DNA-binding MarR family transcriptional regulator